MRIIVMGALCVASAHAACKPVSNVPPDRALRARAAHDLACPEAHVTVSAIDDLTRGVSGCGQRATYVQHCPEPNRCTWVLNTPQGGGMPPPASPPPATQ